MESAVRIDNWRLIIVTIDRMDIHLDLILSLSYTIESSHTNFATEIVFENA
jgi:hypothetical protein